LFYQTNVVKIYKGNIYWVDAISEFHWYTADAYNLMHCLCKYLKWNKSVNERYIWEIKEKWLSLER
jgi:hypothetical protein